MQRSEIITQWRKMMVDDAGFHDAHKLWDEAEAESLFSDACDALCEETRYFIGAMIDSVCLVPLVVGQRHYKLHPAIISVENARPSWKTRHLDRLDVDSIDSLHPQWLTNTGRPCAFLLDYEPDYISLSNEPDTAGDSIRLTVVRRQVDNDSNTLEIPAQWHKHLKHYMAYQALFKQDTEVAGATNQADFKVTWDKAVEQMKQDILKMRRSSVSTSFVG